MSDTPQDAIDRLITDHGTYGLAQMIAEVCRERSKTDDEPGMAEFWQNEAARFAAVGE